MIKKRVWRYSCEYCGKNKGHKGAMELHEEICVKNPERWCRTCENPAHLEVRDHIALSIGLRFTSQVSDEEFAEILGDIENIAEHCPRCMLAGMVQAGYGSTLFGWNYEQAVRDYWEETRAIANDREISPYGTH